MSRQLMCSESGRPPYDSRSKNGAYPGRTLLAPSAGIRHTSSQLVASCTIVPHQQQRLRVRIQRARKNAIRSGMRKNNVPSNTSASSNAPSFVKAVMYRWDHVSVQCGIDWEKGGQSKKEAGAIPAVCTSPVTMQQFSGEGSERVIRKRTAPKPGQAKPWFEKPSQASRLVSAGFGFWLHISKAKPGQEAMA
ncbi:hypothetical protein C8R43DRAFT_1111951 [Mycena crocata]|nr:hypothetical protein C8R43DRAFT_1111951 [Mycena crocata]